MATCGDDLSLLTHEYACTSLITPLHNNNLHTTIFFLRAAYVISRFACIGLRTEDILSIALHAKTFGKSWPFVGTLAKIYPTKDT